ncbi:tRNA pseudouridine(13) synthase TruD [Geobacter sp. SVR]|uniref:tRNA pseudouridine(13) synthase TruD n=1 Tax=Geobacter sp. SVR TaxID=2495594 RepID=UPI00351C1E20
MPGVAGYLTAGIPETGGTIKESPEDFVVTELPAYEPCGEGEHVYLTIEKRGMTTLEAIRRVARELRTPERDIGYAGMKDSVGITRQMISLQRIRPEDVVGRDLNGVRVIAAARHGNKLRLGHLKGNRFRIAVRDVIASAAETAPAVIALLEERGVPNRFGFQRYGAQGNSHLIGKAMLRRDWQAAVECLLGEPQAVRDADWRAAIEAYRQGDLAGALRLMPRHCQGERDILRRLATRPQEWEKAFAVVHPRLKKLYLSACQSSLFDRVVERRLSGIDQVVAGDLAWKHDNGACFLVDDASREAPRAARFEISATGPLFGTRMKWPAGDILADEQQLLAEEGLSPEVFDLGKGLVMEGERRPLRVPLGEPRCSVESGTMLLEFSLPKGSYATSVIREITKAF